MKLFMVPWFQVRNKLNIYSLYSEKKMTQATLETIANVILLYAHSRCNSIVGYVKHTYRILHELAYKVL